MLAGRLVSTHPDEPVSGFEVADVPPPEEADGAVLVDLRAAGLNQRDLWLLRGEVPVARTPVTLGSDGAGVRRDTGQEVVLHALLPGPSDQWPGGDEVLSPQFAMLGGDVDGTLARTVSVPERNLVPKPSNLSWAEAACLPTAWLTAWRALTTRGAAQAGESVLVQGASGGVATAALLLAKALGCWVAMTSREEAHLSRALALDADEAIETGGRLSRRVDLVIETVGVATWGHSLRSVAPGGRIVTAGATTGTDPPADLGRLYRRGIDVRGTSMGTLDELRGLCAFVDAHGVRPVIGRVDPLERAADGLAALGAGAVFGKAIIEVSA